VTPAFDTALKRQIEAQRGDTSTGGTKVASATINLFADLKARLDKQSKGD
jgi:hypothetical protein